MKHTEKDCQQMGCVSSRIVSIHSAGPMLVRVHEIRDHMVVDTPWRYCISLDLKFREIDAMRPFGWCGCTKSEATLRANQLASKVASAVLAVKTAETSKLRGQELLLKLNRAKLDGLLAPYVAEVMAA